MHRLLVRDLHVGAEVAPRLEGDLLLGIEVGDRRVEGLVDVEALRRDPGDVDEQHR